MMYFSLSRWLPFLGAAAALLAGLLLPGAVNASCGDYVTIGSGHVKQQPAAPAVPVSNPAKPCDGPSCQKQSEAPLAPPTYAPVVITDIFCCFSQTRTPVSNRVGWTLSPHLRLPARRSSDIFHPPRIATV